MRRATNSNGPDAGEGDAMVAVMTRKRMSKTAMRVAIAKDVISQVRWKEIVPIMSQYVDRSQARIFNCDLDLQPQVEDLKCRVCAKGALFIAHVRRFDGVVASNCYGDGDVCLPLLNYFHQDQLDLIEQFYEWGEDTDGYKGCKYPKSDGQKAFERANRGRTARLIAIMRNIVRNKGTFKP